MTTSAITETMEETAIAYLNLASRHEVEENFSEALQTLKRATQLFPDEPDPFFRQAHLLLKMGHVNKAIGLFKDLTQRMPKYILSYNQLALLHEARGLIDEALEYWKCTFKTNDPNLHSRALTAYLKSPTITNEQILEAHLDWARRYAQPHLNQGVCDFPKYDGKRPINVAYTCSYWQVDTIRFQLLPILRQRDPAREKVFAYANAGGFSEEEIAETQASVDVFRPMWHLSPKQFIEQAREDQIDVLVELNGHSPGHRFVTMASRCAPVQVSYLNYVGTSGVPNVDYIIADDACILPEEEKYFTEKIYRVPGSFFSFNYESDPLSTSPSDAPCLKNKYVTFGCFGSGGKINQILIGWWAEILKKEPTAKLFIRNNELTPTDNRKFMEESFAKHGVDKSRLILKEGANRMGVIESYREVDISLDTYPYCGGNTIAESLWQGVPVITLKGHRFAAAYGASELQAAGCPELISYTKEEYIDKAITLARDVKRIVYYRQNLRQMAYEHGYTNSKAFATKLEDAYEDMLLQAQRAESFERQRQMCLDVSEILTVPNPKCREFLAKQTEEIYGAGMQSPLLKILKNSF
ncbi:MAG: hypothetical protein ACOY3I_08240 [Verrucomicrobiota bacterium]